MRLLIVLASFATIVALAPCAHADPDPDASFLAELKNAGFTTPGAAKFTQIAESVFRPQQTGGECRTILSVAANPGGTVDRKQ